MQILVTDNFSDYELLDSGGGKRLERFGKYVLIRPDPQVIWKPRLATLEWQKADAIYGILTPNNPKSPNSKGSWRRVKNIPESWTMNYQDISFQVRLSPFKHTGVFPEQAAHWEWLSTVIKNPPGPANGQPHFRSSLFSGTLRGKNGAPSPLSPSSDSSQPNILNLFGYTGIASLVAAKAGARVTHVDASYPAIGWAKENQKLSGLEEKSIRWILDDVIKFVEREIKRGVKYDGILMDPPIYGHGPKGEVWDFNKSFPELMALCKKLLSDNPLFFLVNAYAISASSLMLENVLKDFFLELGGEIESGELVLKEKSAGRLLSTGIFARWSKNGKNPL